MARSSMARRGSCSDASLVDGADRPEDVSRLNFQKQSVLADDEPRVHRAKPDRMQPPERLLCAFPSAEDSAGPALTWRLNVLSSEVIDLYQIHWANWNVPIAETMRAMETLVDRGQVRYIGVSNFSLTELRHAQAAM